MLITIHLAFILTNDNPNTAKQCRREVICGLGYEIGSQMAFEMAFPLIPHKLGNVETRHLPPPLHDRIRDLGAAFR